MAKYGYFKNCCEISFTGTLADHYKKLEKIPNIEIYYDYIGKRKRFYYNRLLKKLKPGDQLHVLRLFDLGESNSKIIKQFELFRKLNIELYVVNQKIDIDALFDEIEVETKFNSEHLKCGLRYVDILDNVFRKFFPSMF